MMGERTVMQEALFYSFSLERHVPDDHLLRRIDRFVDLADIREHLRPYYSDTGRPSIDPELMIRMLLIGYCLGIRSERRLCEEVHLNLAYRWFFRLGLDGAVPDHSTFSKNRHGRFRDSDLLRRLFETSVERCLAEGLVGGDERAASAEAMYQCIQDQLVGDQREWHSLLDGQFDCRLQVGAQLDRSPPCTLKSELAISRRTARKFTWSRSLADGRPGVMRVSLRCTINQATLNFL